MYIRLALDYQKKLITEFNVIVYFWTNSCIVRIHTFLFYITIFRQLHNRLTCSFARNSCDSYDADVKTSKLEREFGFIFNSSGSRILSVLYLAGNKFNITLRSRNVYDDRWEHVGCGLSWRTRLGYRIFLADTERDVKTGKFGTTFDSRVTRAGNERVVSNAIYK